MGDGPWKAERAGGERVQVDRVDVAFLSPVLLPSTVERRTGRASDGWDLDVRGAGSGRVHLRAAVRG